MSSVNANIRFERTEYRLHFSHHLNFITGDSSIGKSFLFIIKKRLRVEISGNCRVVFNTDPRLVTHVTETILAIYDIEDEQYSVFTEEFKELLKIEPSNIYIVLIGRKAPRWLPLSVHNIYTFITHKYIVELSPLYPIKHLMHLAEFNNLVTEDSTSSYSFWKELIDTTFTSNGNSNLCKEEYLSSDACYLVDALGFGAYISDFLYWFEKYRFSYVLHDSHEAMLLKLLFNESSKEIKEIAFNEEDAVTKYLWNITDRHYSKHSGCGGACCTRCPSNCKNFNIKAILNATFYKQLLDDYTPKLSTEATEILTNRYKDYSQYLMAIAELQHTAEVLGCSLEEVVQNLPS